VNSISSMFSIFMPALIAGILILFTHIPLGRYVLQRGIIFVDLAIAQIAGLGIILGSMLGFDLHGWQLQVIALLSAMAGALLLSVVENFLQEKQEAFIGIVFVLAASASILLLAGNPHGGEQLKDLLVGQILWVEWQQLIYPALVSTLVFALWLFKRHVFSSKAFYFIFALSITVSVQLVGVYLVFASLILPALVTLKHSENKALVIGFAVGALSYAMGLWLSSVFDLPSGAMIVWAMAVVAVVFAALVPALRAVLTTRK
jgi:zinc/manganese transport system permease protein